MAKIVAVCACPMGLAHTFMAADSLKKAAGELGHEIKVETQGADGVQSELSKKEIREADVIIHAIAITPQDMERFEEYEVHEVSLKEAIRNAKGLIEELTKGL